MRKYFLLYINNSNANKILNFFLTVVHIAIHDGGNNSGITEAWNIVLKTSKPPWKIWKYKMNILHVLKKTNLTVEWKTHSTV